jgi:Mg2+ and Co2+ transporter CorA
VAVDDRIDRALKEMRELGDTLRASFSVLHVQQSQEDRERSERLQRRVEVMAAGFLVPTLVVGFYGANTWVPGQGSHWGFWAMVVILVLMSIGAIALVSYWHRQQRREDERVRAERRSLQRQLLRDAAEAG